MWYEEMINNRNKSVVRDMKWTADGRKIAIVYEDGAVIVGSVDGNRLWGKDLNFPLRFVEWSPDGKILLFVTLEAEVYVFDADGNKLRNFPLIGQEHSGLGGDSMITSIHWFCPANLNHYHAGNALARNGEPLPSTLCIAFENGKVQISRGDDDSTAELIDTDLTTVEYVRWSTKGHTLAVVGTQSSMDRSQQSTKGGDKGMQTVNVVKFYDNYGRFIRNIKIPGEQIREVSWEGGDLRLALAVDSFIYFANIRHRYMWTYFLNTVTYAYPRPEKREHTVMFWDQLTQETYVKSVPNLKFLTSAGDVCAIIVSERVSQASLQKASSSSSGKSQSKDEGKEDNANEKSCAQKELYTDIYTIQLRNAIGAVVDTKQIPFAPKYVAMSPYHVVCCNDRTVFVWQFQQQNVSSRGNGMGGSANSLLDDNDDIRENDDTGKASSNSRKGGKARIFDVANISFTNAQSPETFKIITESLQDPITAVTVSDKFVGVARKNGLITRFNLPHLTPENSYTLRDKEIVRMHFNCSSTKVAVVDVNGIFNILDLEYRVPESSLQEEKDSSNGSPNTKNTNSSFNGGNNGNYLGPMFGRKCNVERKDVWDVCWSDNDSDMIVIMEKTKMIVFHDETPEEPVTSSAYLARFKDLEIRVVALDTLMQHPDKVNKDFVVDFESKLLREVREKIASEGLQVAYDYADHNPHPRLWKLLALAALEDLELGVAEKAFVRFEDYYGIQLVKQLASMPDKMKARAEVAVYLNRFDEAESIYREIDRKDLAIQLRKRLGDDKRVVQLLQTGGGNDKLVKEAWDQIGFHYVDRMSWKKAAQYFQLSRNYEQLMECYYRLELFPDLKKLATELPDENPLLYTLAKRFESVGMVDDAVDCFLRSNCSPKEAIDCCVKANKWGKALELAEKHDFPQVEGLLMKYAIDLYTSNRKLEAIELFRAANKPTEAAIWIGDLAENVVLEKANPSLAKKLHVLAALEIERHRKRAIDQATQQQQLNTLAQEQGGIGGIAQATAQTLETLMMTSLLEGGGNNTTLGGTLQMTLNTLAGTTQGGMTSANAKKVSRAFANAWRGAAAYHYYMLALRQFYGGQ
jgi:WD repeat-containing protein 35